MKTQTQFHDKRDKGQVHLDKMEAQMTSIQKDYNATTMIHNKPQKA